MKRIALIRDQLASAAIKKIMSEHSPLAIARSQYKLNNEMANNNATEFMQKYKNYISLDQKLDSNNLFHQEIALTLYKYREGVKFFGQEVTRKIYPEVMKMIDDRQIELYGSITKNPYTDLDAAVKSKAILDKLADKGMSIGQLKDTTFKSGGKDIVVEEINKFSSIFADVISKDINITENILDIFKKIFEDTDIKEKFIEEPKVGLTECFYDQSSIKSDIPKEFTTAYSEKLQEDILTKESKDSIDTEIKSNHNKEFQDSIKNIDDINPNNLNKIDDNVLKNSKDHISGMMKNQAMSTLKTHDSSDPVVKNALDSISNKLEPYIRSTSEKFSSDSIYSFNQEHSGEVQQKVASIDNVMKSTQQEIETKKQELENLKNDTTISAADKEKRMQDLNKEIQNRIKEIEKAQEHRDVLEPTQEERDKREKEHEEIEDKTWKEHKVKFETLNSIFISMSETNNNTIDKNKEVTDKNKKVLDGNFIDQIEDYLLNKAQGIKETGISNNVDVGYRSYDIKGSKIETLIVEEMTGEITILQTDNQQLFMDILGAM